MTPEELRAGIDLFRYRPPGKWVVTEVTHPDHAVYIRRRRRIKAVFEGRVQQLELARQLGQRSYGDAIAKYIRAHRAWRNIRGWV